MGTLEENGVIRTMLPSFTAYSFVFSSLTLGTRHIGVDHVRVNFRLEYFRLMGQGTAHQNQLFILEYDGNRSPSHVVGT